MQLILDQVDLAALEATMTSPEFIRLIEVFAAFQNAILK